MQALDNNLLSGKRVLVTGGLGFIGSNLAIRCLELGAEVCVFDNRDSHCGGNSKNLDGFEKKMEMVDGDIRDYPVLAKAVMKRDLIFHCAAQTSHPHSQVAPSIDIDVNCKGAINLLEATLAFSPDAHFIYPGTSTQIGKMRYEPIDELHPELPVDIYSADKCAAEKYCFIYAKAHGLRTTVIRLANTYGPRAAIRSAEFGFINFFIGLALQKKEITVFGEGTQLRNVNFVGDTVDALIMAAINPITRGELYFATSSDQISVANIAEAIVAEIGGKVKRVEWPKDRAAIEIGDAIISNKKIVSALGWQPKTNFVDGLRVTKEYFEPVLRHYV